MRNYLQSLAARIDQEDSAVLIWEAAEAFAEADPSALSPPARALHELVRFCELDAIAPWLRNERDVLHRVLAYARNVGADEVAEILGDALNGKPRDVKFSVSPPGAATKELVVDADESTRFDGVDYGGTDIALSFAMEAFEIAVLRDLAAAADELALDAPVRVQRRAAADATVQASAGALSAAALFKQLVETPNPHVLAGSAEEAEQRSIAGARAVPVSHWLGGPANPASLVAAREQFGSIADELLSVYVLHDGAELFRFEGECGFCLAPMAAWEELLDHAVGWARDVTWQDDEDEIPPYLYSAIAFGLIPGDSERWLFITEGPHAGKIMLSNSDLIEDQARFDSLAHFFSAMVHDTGRVLGSGGYVRYEVAGEELFPIAYAEGTQAS